MTRASSIPPLPSIPTIASYLKQGDERKKSMENCGTETTQYSEDNYYPSVVSTSSKVFSKGEDIKKGRMPTTQHLQYNSPMAIYSRYLSIEHN
uniref:Uncharacterized protein n=1 Tax=Parastrongyloides trichosuri TaxID=131310 RepID=A0A0N5A4A3_PARTI